MEQRSEPITELDVNSSKNKNKKKVLQNKMSCVDTAYTYCTKDVECGVPTTT